MSRPDVDGYEPWRWRCPRGHAGWFPRGDGYYCRTCQERGEPSDFDRLRDAKELSV